MKITTDTCDLIGNTPLLELSKIYPDCPSRILAKMELTNPTSVKDRAVLNMIRTAKAEGMITRETEVVEASSGNTAIAIASDALAYGRRA